MEVSPPPLRVTVPEVPLEEAPERPVRGEGLCVLQEPPDGVPDGVPGVPWCVVLFPDSERSRPLSSDETCCCWGADNPTVRELIRHCKESENVREASTRMGHPERGLWLARDGSPMESEAERTLSALSNGKRRIKSYTFGADR